MAKRKQRKRYVTIRVPGTAWEVLWQSLDLDTESGAVDPPLRKEIQRAMNAVVVKGYEDVPAAELRDSYERRYREEFGEPGWKYPSFGEAGEGPKDWSPRERVLILRIPEGHWATMVDSLILDMESGRVDPELRKRLRDAFSLILEE